MSAARAVIFGCEGLTLTAQERSFFAQVDPWGFILFARNIESASQVRTLIAELREIVGRTAPVLIDQEGGRVARLRPPTWRGWMPALEYCALAGPDFAEAMYLRGRMIAADLYALGIDVNCAPILDIAGPDTHPIVENRCYGKTPGQIAEAGRALAEGQLAGGVLSIIKHIPGHGRGNVDSHLSLPRIAAELADLRATDFAPFRDLADLPMAMTAHIVFEAIDPETPVTLSSAGVRVIRGEIGFDGLLMTDDLSMKALGGSFGERTRLALAAGCDLILHCNGDIAEMEPIAANIPRLSGLALARADAALAQRHAPDDFDLPEAEVRLKTLIRNAA